MLSEKRILDVAMAEREAHIEPRTRRMIAGAN
jgi:hypothetical protein